ncbi:MAG: hypothetical protein ACTSP3_09630 [Candidatus Heimdallarchaeaceae archaeon]
MSKPTAAKELRVTAEEVIKALEIAYTVRDRLTILGSEGLLHDVVVNVTLKTGVIN